MTMIPPQATQPAAEPKRYGVLDAYRFVAAAGVVLYHYEGHFQPYLAQPTHYLERLHLFVDFFFVLSGFVLMHTYGGKVVTLAAYASFMRKRLARIYPLHAVMTLAFAGLGLAALALHWQVRDPAALNPAAAPAHLLLIHAWGIGLGPALNFQSWSISAEFFVYLLFPLLAAIVLRLGPPRALLLAYGIGLAMTLARDALGLRPWEQTTFDFGNLRAVPSFLAGMAVQAFLAGRILPRIPFALAHLAALALMGLMLVHGDELLIVALFPPLIALIAAAERSGATSAMGRGLWLHLGDASYGVYLIHTMVIMASLVVMRKLGLTSPAALVALALTGTGAATLLAMASYRWFENPARRFLGGTGKHAGARRPAATPAAPQQSPQYPS